MFLCVKLRKNFGKFLKKLYDIWKVLHLHSFWIYFLFLYQKIVGSSRLTGIFSKKKRVLTFIRYVKKKNLRTLLAMFTTEGKPSFRKAKTPMVRIQCDTVTDKVVFLCIFFLLGVGFYNEGKTLLGGTYSDLPHYAPVYVTSVKTRSLSAAPFPPFACSHLILFWSQHLLVVAQLNWNFWKVGKYANGVREDWKNLTRATVPQKSSQICYNYRNYF